MIVTDVEYTIGLDKVTVSIPHFQPTTKADVLLGVENREMSEERKLQATKACESIISQIEITL